MESITKNRQPPEALRAMVARAFGDERAADGDGWAEELGHGWFNVVYRIRLRDGEHVALKIAPPAEVEVMTYERGALRTELLTLDLIRKHTTVPVPDVLFHDATRELCDAEYFFMEFVEGENLGIVLDRLPDAERDGYSEALGAANRQINGITGAHFGPLPGGVAGAGWRQVFTGMFEGVLADGARRGVDLGWDYDLVRTVLAEHADCLDEVGVPALVEWDLWESNVLIRDGAITCIIDHERAFYGDPLIEAGFVATELDGLAHPAAFLRGYGSDTRAFTPSERLRRRLYNLHLILIMVIETVYRGHTDPAQYDQARARLDTVMADFGHRR
jgi:aminoglycoside phosphotransferase (APT) family kinase protein